MSIADLLSGIGTGAAKVGRVAGAVLEPIARRTAEVVSGEAPQIDEERRQKAQALDDESRERRANELEAQLEMGRKYGTLTPDQQKQYVDEVTSLYSHPSQMGSLMKRLQKAIHPQGTVYQPSAPLKDATPVGGTAAADEAARESALADALGLRQQATDEEIDRRAADQAQAKSGQKKPLSGVKPFQDAASKTWYQPMVDAQGNVTNEAVPNYVPPAPKSTGAVSTQYATLYGKSLLAKSGKGPPLTPEEQAQLEGLRQAMTIGPISRAEAMAKYGAMYNLVQTQDPATGADVWMPRMNVLTAAQGGNPVLASRNSQKAMLAASALQQANTISDILDAHPGLVGPIEGRKNAIEEMGGIQSPDFARLVAAATYLAEHGAGVFGSRNIKTVQELENVITNPAFNVDAFRAALDQSRLTNEMFLNPQGARMPNAGAKPVQPSQILPKTGVRPTNATGTAQYEGKTYWVDKDGNNLGERMQ